MGFMIITEKSDQLIGSFEFKAYDLNGNVGTEIKKGKLFVVDTLAPIAPSDLNLKRVGENQVELWWHYAGEEPDKFNIYRSTSKYVNYADILHSTTVDYFIDNVNLSEEEYFYKVAAVDRAGNIGELSDAANVTVNGTEVVSKFIDGRMRDITISGDALARIESQLSRVENLAWLASNALSDLKIMSGIESEVVEKLELIDGAEHAKSGFEDMRAELSVMRYATLDDDEVNVRLSRISKRVDELEKRALSSLDIIESTQQILSINEVQLKQLMGELPLDAYSKREKQEYEDANMALLGQLL